MLALNTPLVLLDEPANGLDIEARSSLRRMLIDASSPERTIIVTYPTKLTITTLPTSFLQRLVSSGAVTGVHSKTISILRLEKNKL